MVKAEGLVMSALYNPMVCAKLYTYELVTNRLEPIHEPYEGFNDAWKLYLPLEFL